MCAGSISSKTRNMKDINDNLKYVQDVKNDPEFIKDIADIKTHQ
jgi:hypothetical protein